MTANLPQASSSKLDESRYADIDMVLDRKGPWTQDHFVGGQAVRSYFLNTDSDAHG